MNYFSPKKNGDSRPQGAPQKPSDDAPTQSAAPANQDPAFSADSADWMDDGIDELLMCLDPDDDSCEPDTKKARI